MDHGKPDALHEIGTPEFHRALVDTSISPYVVIDHNLILRYASASITQLLGWPLEDWIGRSVVDLLVPESLDVVAVGLGDMVTQPTNIDWVGAPVRIFLRCADGTSLPVDAEASSAERTGIEGVVVQLHRAGSSQTMSDAIDAILEGQDPHRALSLLASLIEHSITDTRAVLADGWDGILFSAVTGMSSFIDLGAPNTQDRDALRWGMATDRDVIDLFPRLSRTTRAAAVEKGMRACWLAPVRVAPDAPPTAALVIWNTDRGAPGALYTTDIRRSVNLARLSLQWQHQQRMLAWEVAHDQLTGLINRGEFQSRLNAHSSGQWAILFCDLDNFKPVNDRFGHMIGDQVLSAVAGRLAGVSGPHVAARLGGDEFAVLLDPLGSPTEATDLAIAILESLKRPISTSGHHAEVGVSVGVAIDVTGQASSDLLLDEADRLLRQAKAMGKGQVCVVTID